MIVVDASVAVHALANDGEAGTAARDRLRGETQLAPHVLDVEVLHTLRRFVRTRIVSVDRAWRAIDDLRRLAVTRVPHHGLVHRAWELRDDVSAHDAVYVALAELFDAPLLTTNARLATAPGLRCDVEVLATPA